MDEERRKPSVWNTPPQSSVIDLNALQGKKPNRVVSVPLEYRRQTLVRERDTLINDLRVETDCIVIPNGNQTVIRSFYIFGSGSNVEKAVRHLNQWISKAHVKSIASSAWAKMPAYNSDKWYYNEVERLELERKQRFKGPLPQAEGDDIPEHKVTIDWPEKMSEQSIFPREVFGGKLEGLDKLRMQDEVWMNLVRSDTGLWQIEIIGYEAGDVEAAREHLETLVKQAHADHSGVQVAHNIILDDREGIDVELQQDGEWWPFHADTVVPRLLTSGIMNEPGSFRQEGLDSGQISGIRQALQSALDNVRGRKGAYDFAVRLGSLALSSTKLKMEKTVKKETFLKAIQGPIDLEVKKWLANDDVGYKILLRLMSANDVLEPTRSTAYYGYAPKSLDKTRPTYKGTWVFKDPNDATIMPRAPPRHSGRPVPISQKSPNNDNPASHQPGLFVVQIEWTDDEQGCYEKGAPRFYMLGNGKSDPKKNMDVNLLELGESRGWHFALESLMPISTKAVSPVLASFASRVAMKAKYDPLSCESFTVWDATPTIKKHLVNARMESIYCFGLKGTCYKAELTAMWYPQMQQKKPVWGLAVRHSEWATHLAELERLAIGRQAGWGDSISTFFPDGGQMSSCVEDYDEVDLERLRLDEPDEEPLEEGLTALTDKLMMLSEIVSSVTVDKGGVSLNSSWGKGAN